MAQTLYLRRGRSARASRMAVPDALILADPQRQQIIDARQADGTNWLLILDGKEIGQTRSYSEGVQTLNNALTEVPA